MQLASNPTFRGQGLTISAALWCGLAAAAVLGLAMPALAAEAGLALAMALLTLFVAAIVATFSLRYMRADDSPARFFAALGGLVVTVLATLFTGNLVVLGHLREDRLAYYTVTKPGPRRPELMLFLRWLKAAV